MYTDNIKPLLDYLNVDTPANVTKDISFYLSSCKHVNNHISFIVDVNSRRIIFYKFNVFYNSTKFPYSSHSEVEGIKHYLKKYKSRHNSKIIFIVVKVSKTGKIGNSKPCKYCAIHLHNHFSNINIDSIFYSTNDNELVSLNKNSLLNNEFKISAGFNRKFI